MEATLRNKWLFALLLLLFSAFFVQKASSQRYLVYYPSHNLKKKIQINVGDMLDFKTKSESGFQRGFITNIDVQHIYFNDLILKISAIDKIKVYTGKSRAIIPRIIGYGAQLYIVVRVINSLIQNDKPIISPLELAITLPIIAAYYIYEFAFNTKYKVYKVSENKPLKPIIFR